MKRPCCAAHLMEPGQCPPLFTLESWHEADRRYRALWQTPEGRAAIGAWLRMAP